MKYISVDNISFSYGEKNVFENFSAEFPTKKLSVIMSPSGSGKTTLLYLIAGLLKPSCGNITYPDSNPKFSMVFQDNRLIDSLSVFRNIKMANSNLSLEDITDCLKALGIDGMHQKKVKDLSGGEKQRVAIARALLADYEILLMDEPFTGLDKETKLSVINYVKNRTANKTVLLVTHHKTDAELCGGSIFTI